ncbi:MAG: DUF4357 domain-containing protein [Marinobacter sp.]|nr:DUF4357 domain-containing protein [Marinobacter sp.]
MPPSSPSPTFSESESETVFELRTPKYGRDARAVLTEGEFVVLAGSIASPSAAATIVNGGATNGTIEWRLPSGRLTKPGRLKSYKRKKLNDFA